MKEVKKEAKKRIEQINIKIGRNLLQARLAAGLKASQLSKMVHVAQQQIAKYESGENKVSIGRLVLIAEALSVDLFSFFDGIYDKTSSKNTGIRKRLAGELSRNFIKIKRLSQQQIINQMVKELADNQEEEAKE